jgi:hypothetical protein
MSVKSYNPYTNKPPVPSSPSTVTIDPFYGFIPRKTKAKDVVRLIVRNIDANVCAIVEFCTSNVGWRCQPVHPPALYLTVQKASRDTQEATGIRADGEVLQNGAYNVRLLLLSPLVPYYSTYSSEIPRS